RAALPDAAVSVCVHAPVFHLAFAYPHDRLAFLFTDTASPEVYPLSLHDALPISPDARIPDCWSRSPTACGYRAGPNRAAVSGCRSEEHTSELQSRENLVCRLLLEKKNRWAPWTPTSSWRWRTPRTASPSVARSAR